MVGKQANTTDSNEANALCRQMEEQNCPSGQSSLGVDSGVARFSLDRAAEAIYWIDREARVQYVNDMASRMLGYSREELLEMRVEDFDPHYPQDVWHQHWADLRARRILVFESHHRAKDGQLIPVEIAANYLEHDGREYNCALVRDVREREAAVAILRESEEKYRTLVEQARDGVAVIQGGIIRYANPRLAAMISCDVEDLVGRAFEEVVCREDVDTAAAHYERGLRGEEVEPVFRLGLVRADGSTVASEVSAATISYEGLPARQVIVRDVTEQERVRVELENSERRYRNLVELAPDGIVTIDTKGVVTSINQAFVDLTGYSKEEVIGTPISKMGTIRAQDVPGYTGLFADLLRGKPTDRLRFRYYRQDGEERVGEAHVAVMHDGGKVTGLQALLTDITERHQADERLRESEERYRNLVEMAPEGILTLDAKGVITSVNAALLAMTARDRGELVGCRFSRVGALRERDIPGFLKLFSRVLQGRASGPIEFDVVRKDGEWRRLVAHVARMRLAGKVTGVQVIVGDVTEERRAREALRDSELQYRTTYDSMDDAVHVVDRDLRIVLANASVKRWAARMGVTGDLVGQPLLEVFRFLPERAREEYERVFRTGETVATEEAASVQGEIRALQIRKIPVLEGKKVVRVITVARDATAAKEAEEERERLLNQVRERAEQVQQIMDSVPVGVLLLDGEGRVILANPLAGEALSVLADVGVGDQLATVGGRRLSGLLAPEEAGARGAALVESDSGEQFELVARPVGARDGGRGWVLVVRNVTEELKVQRQLRQQDRLAAVGELAAGIAHDFNNMLTTIMLYAQILLREKEIGSAVVSGLETMLDETRKAADLVQQILDFSRRSPMETRPVDLRSLVKEAVGILRRTLPESIRLRVDLGDSDCVVDVDPTRIEQVLMNLVVNARDAMSDGGRLRIELGHAAFGSEDELPLPQMRRGDWVCLRVADTGSGIAAEDVPRIFEPFFTTKPTGQGTGLGLAQVYGIIKQHGGYVTVDTELGDGSTFSVFLPPYVQDEDLGTESADAEVRTLKSGRETILLAEDEERVRNVAREALESFGYRVLVAKNGVDALGLAQRVRHIDLVVTDMVMPEMGGRELLQEMRAIQPTSRALVITGYALDEDLDALREQGVGGVLLKPFDIGDLGEMVRRVLDEAHAQENVVAEG
jgi:two-component system cell cycle sensor histidine kinase/response regulator CckA